MQGSGIFALVPSDPVSCCASRVHDNYHVMIPASGLKLKAVIESDISDCEFGILTILPTLSPKAMQQWPGLELPTFKWATIDVAPSFIENKHLYLIFY